MSYTKIIRLLEHMIAPPYCSGCWRPIDQYEPLCSACKDGIEPIIAYPITSNSGYTIPVYALGAYTGPLKKLICAKQYHNYIASEELGQLLAAGIQMPPLQHPTSIVPIPIHWTRYAWRGFNQTDAMAAAVAARYGVPTAPLLRRREHTPFQYLHNRTQRTTNLTHAFCWNEYYSKELYQESHIILIDDLLTTGATINAAAQLLIKTIKPRSIRAIVAARVV